jgi:hypothetical protein
VLRTFPSQKGPQCKAQLLCLKRRIRDDWVDNNGLVIASNWPSPDTDSVASEVSAGGWLK